ncbi:cytochrome P450 4X1-like [Glandiceps talaboti]
MVPYFRSVIIFILGLLSSIVEGVQRSYCKKRVPMANVFSRSTAWMLCGDDKLKQLEYYSHHFNREGVFQFGSWVVVCNSKLANYVIKHFDKGSDDVNRSILSDSFLSSHENNPSARRAIAALLRKSVIESKSAEIAASARDVVLKLRNDTAVDITEEMQRFSLDVLAKCVFGLDLNGIHGDHVKLFNAMNFVLHDVYAMQSQDEDSPTFVSANETIDDAVQMIIDKMEEARNLENFLENDQTNLRCVLDDVDNLKATVKLLLLAGTETTASSLPIMLHILATNDDIQREIQAELDMKFKMDDTGQLDGSHLAEFVAPLPVLESFMKETLRLFPIAPYIIRKNTDQAHLGGYSVPENSNIMVFTWGIQRSESVWKDAMTLDPERFLKKKQQQEKTLERREKTFIPFGAGSRVCVGQHIAWSEIKIMLAIILKYKTVELANKKNSTLSFVVDWVHAVVHPRRKIRLNLRKRK